MIQADLTKANSFYSLTCDGWQSHSLNSYLGVTCHYVDKSFELKKRTLALKFLEESHTSDYLAKMINECSSEWQINDKASIFQSLNRKY